MRTYSANAIVLRRTDLGEKDRILTLFTRESGKVSAVAKGSRRPGSRLAAATEPFTCSRMFFGRGRNLDVISQAETKESFPAVRNDLRRIACAVYILELVASFTDDAEPNPDLFDTLLSALYVLESGADPRTTARYFELQIMSLLGYEPHFGSCLRCGREIGRERVSFSPSMGGIVCGRCGPAPADGIEIPGAAASYARALLRAEPQTLKDMHIPAGAHRDLATVMRWHIRYRLERDLKSVEFLESIDRFEEQPAGQAQRQPQS